MNRHTQFQKIISFLMIFILLIQLSGCYSYNIISSSDLPHPNSYEYTFIINGQNTRYVLENTVISNSIFLGKISSGSQNIKGKINVYLSSDTVMKINPENILSTPLDGIGKVEIKKLETGETVLLTIAGLVLGFITYGIIDLAINGLGMELSF